MPDFFYQVSALGEGAYNWTPVYKGHAVAADKKAAKKQINEIFDMDLKEKISRKVEKPQFRLFVIEMDETWKAHWLDVRQCEVCQRSYSILAAFQEGHKATKEICSDGCWSARRKPYVPDHLEAGYTNAKPVIYKITNKKTKRCYVGKTTRPFTLRWWEHFFHPSDSKFHTAIKESSVLDWTFEVVELLEPNSTVAAILAREQYFIKYFESVSQGYNSVDAVSDKNDLAEIDERQTVMTL